MRELQDNFCERSPSAGAPASWSKWAGVASTFKFPPSTTSSIRRPGRTRTGPCEYSFSSYSRVNPSDVPPTSVGTAPVEVLTMIVHGMTSGSTPLSVVD